VPDRRSIAGQTRFPGVDDFWHLARRSRRWEVQAAAERLGLTREEVVHSLAAGLRDASQARSFDRSARMLARLGGDAAFEALATAARTTRRFPRLAVRALAQCPHPMVVPALLDLLGHGRISQRRAAAAALGRLRAPAAVEPLCREASRGLAGIGPEARDVLRRMGRAWQLGRLVLGAVDLATPEKVSALRALEVLRLDAERFLVREQRRFGPAAEEALSLLRAQKTLLRPSGSGGDSVLLRPASGARGASEHLVRASDDPGHAPPDRHGWVRRLCRAAGRLLANGENPP